MKNALSILLMFLGFSSSATAVTLAPLPEPPSALLNIDIDAPPIACDRILNELMKFKDMNRQHEDSIAAFLGQTVEKISGWYDQLGPLEGQRNRIPLGTFETLKTGSEKMAMIVDYSYDNTALLSAELDRIIVSLRDCSPARRKR